ncbi:hypothetical protein [Microbacterium esteraromaticum]|uniref:hypothetical protein n=1 Tax=Microbacterium esteraromaticum TaxID=57043 RepID=UPI00195CCB85|nr:hypothetical protein [Microbacterium esteraromaticum]MBM7466227.1 intracellular sulfur oxidation DsrE/DsrF family protein [Microbacterium esteraromaticum]
MSDQRTVLLHVSDRPDDIARAIGIAHTLHDARPEYSIRIIVNGPAVRGATRDADPLEVPGFASIEICEGGLRGRGIPVDSLQPGVVTTASAAVAIADAQFDGAAYNRV